MYWVIAVICRSIRKETLNHIYPRSRIHVAHDQGNPHYRKERVHEHTKAHFAQSCPCVFVELNLDPHYHHSPQHMHTRPLHLSAPHFIPLFLHFSQCTVHSNTSAITLHFSF